MIVSTTTDPSRPAGFGIRRVIRSSDGYTYVQVSQGAVSDDPADGYYWWTIDFYRTGSR